MPKLCWFAILLLCCVNRNLLAVTAYTFKLNVAVDLCKKCVIRAAAYVIAGMNMGSALFNKNIAGLYELTVSTLCTKTL